MRKPRLVALFALSFLLFSLSPVILQPASSQVVSATDCEVVYATDLAKAVYEQVSEDSFKNFIIKLTENGSRPFGSEANSHAVSWLRQELVELSGGKIHVTILGNFDSVVGKLPGSLGHDGPSIMIGGHLDSVGVSPGANDDATGVATALELARVLSQYEWPLDIYFCMWNDEESGLHGSKEVAAMFMENETDILVYFNVDMLLVENPNAPPDQRAWLVYQAGPGTIFQDARYWAELTRCMSNNFGNSIIRPVPSNSFPYWGQSDHYPFVQRGYKRNIFAHESGTAYDDAYHTSSDTWDNHLYNYTVAASTVASIGASVAFTMSRTQGQISQSRFSTTLSPGETREYLLDMTLPTEVVTRASWSGGDGLLFTALGPLGSMIATNSTTASVANRTGVLLFNTQDLGLHRLLINNTGGRPVTIEVEIAYETDLEGDSIPDSQEPWFNAFHVDSDDDGLTNADEMRLGLDRFNPDEDGDGLDDGDELNTYHTNPRLSDSDFDGMPDGWEVEHHLNPAQPDSQEDPDHDGLVNLSEYGNGTHPMNNDTDSDGMPDGWEVEHRLNPLVDDSSLDPDGDALTNIQEYLNGRDPNVPDSILIQAVYPSIVVGAAIGLVVIVTYFVWSKLKS